MTLLSILIIGFLLGMKHATESDHLAAVATLATRQHSFAATLKQGVAWGLGHTVTLMLVGGVVLALGTSIPPKLERALEFGVGLMLVGLGVDVLRRIVRQRIHFHVHQHAGEQAHIHAHSHAGETARAAPPHASLRLPALSAHRAGELPIVNLSVEHSLTPHDHLHAAKLPLRALAVGMMHGLAGSAALILLSLHTVQSVPMGILYIVFFGAGSIAGMALLSVAIAVPLRLSSRYLTFVHRGFGVAIGMLTLSLGAWMVYRIGFVEGLLVG